MNEPRPQVRTERPLDRRLPADRPAPHSLEAERAVLSACLNDQEAMGEAAGLLKAEDFHLPRHRAVFSAMEQLLQAGELSDAVSVAVRMEDQGVLADYGGPAFIAELRAVGSSRINLAYHAKIVAEKAQLRQLISIGSEMARESYGDGVEAAHLLDRMQDQLFQLSQKGGKRDYRNMGDLAPATFAHINEAFHRDEKLTGVPTDFVDLDNMTGGLQKSDLVIVAGRPAMGKTSFALNVAMNAAGRHQRPVGIFSLEMSSEQLCMRLIASRARMDNHALRTGKFRESDWPRLTHAVNDLRNTPLFIDDTSSISLLELSSKARRMVAAHQVQLIIIDYLQLISGGTRIENRQQEISLISRTLKGLAKDLNVPIIALSQLSRAVEGRHGNRPMLSDLRESGAIEQDADLVMFVYRQEVYEPENPDVRNLAELILGKHRNGPIGTVKLQFDRQFTAFTSLARDHPAYEQHA